MYDMSMNVVVNPDGSVTGSATISRDGKPFYNGSSTWHGLTPDQVKLFVSGLEVFMSKFKKTTGLTVHEMHRIERKLAEHLLGLGDAKIVEKEAKKAKHVK